MHWKLSGCLILLIEIFIACFLAKPFRSFIGHNLKGTLRYRSPVSLLLSSLQLRSFFVTTIMFLPVHNSHNGRIICGLHFAGCFWLLFMSLFSKLRNCAIFLCSFPYSWSTDSTHVHTHTHSQKAYKAATHSDNCGTIFNICARRLKICNIFYLFLLHKVLRHKIFFAGCHFCRSCCCCVTAFISLCVCYCMCVCACVLAFYDPIWPPSAAYVFVAIFCLFQSLFLSGPGSVLGLWII